MCKVARTGAVKSKRNTAGAKRFMARACEKWRGPSRLRKKPFESLLCLSYHMI
jgi:hypothetical protein